MSLASTASGVAFNLALDIASLPRIFSIVLECVIIRPHLCRSRWFFLYAGGSGTIVAPVELQSSARISGHSEFGAGGYFAGAFTVSSAMSVEWYSLLVICF